ncbi:MAG: hypothetical protein AAB486_04645 [Patescibacteria group bacterium]
MGILDFFIKKNKNRNGWKSPGVTYGSVLKPYDIKTVSDRWGRIEELLTAGKPSALKQAVMEADKLLDYALTQLCSGASMGERLKTANSIFSPETYQNLWSAHKFRNALVHETNFEPNPKSCREAAMQIKDGLKEIGARV